jgi:hypothetical protein
MTIEQVLAVLMTLGMLAFGLFLGVQAFSMLREQLRTWSGARSSKTWAATGGSIEKSELTWQGVRSPRARPVVTYRYQVDGESYVGTRVEFSFTRIYFTPEAQTVLKRYPPGAPVTVYYDPANPAESTLEQRHSSIISGVLVALVLLFPTTLCLSVGLIGLADIFGK